MPGVTERELLKLKHEGWESPLIDLRLRYAAFGSTVNYLQPLVGRERVHPHYLPTQKSGRWSTTNPPLANFSINCINPECPRVQARVEHQASHAPCWSLRDVIIPDKGWWFLKWDWSAIEARLAAAYSEDEEDLRLFELGADIHTVTYCKMVGLPLPPNIMDPYGSPEGAYWRVLTDLLEKGCWQRQGGKITRYSLAYAIDQRGIHEGKDVDLLMQAAGTDKAGLEAIAKAYLDSKPRLREWKRRVWEQIYATHEVRTPLGRRKRLFISSEEYVNWKRRHRPGDAGKQGLNHLAQGQVADMMNLTIIAIKRRWPESRLVYQAHDGLTMAFPNTSNSWPAIREIVEREWDTGNGMSIRSVADWGAVREDGSHEELR